MKYIRAYEALTQKEKEEFIKSSSEPFTTFNINQLRKDCRKYDIIFINLLREILLFKKISFKCEWCYDDEKIDDLSEDPFIDITSHNIIGICEKVRHENERFWDSDVIVKIKNKEHWHTLYTHKEDEKIFNPWSGITHEKETKKRVRVYNYTEGPLMQELETKKNADKYNL